MPDNVPRCTCSNSELDFDCQVHHGPTPPSVPTAEDALRKDLNDIRAIAVKIQPQAILECSRLYDICRRIEERVVTVREAAYKAGQRSMIDNKWEFVRATPAAPEGDSHD